MLHHLRKKIEKKRAQSFVENARAWYQTCSEVSEVMGDALHDQSVIHKDIGYIIDAAVRMLSHMRFFIPASLDILRRRNPELAQRFDKVSQLVYRLRNETTSFLIRSQGPGSMSGVEANEDERVIYYYRALDEVGFHARDLKMYLDRELKFIWQELQMIIVKEEAAVNML